MVNEKLGLRMGLRVRMLADDYELIKRVVRLAEGEFGECSWLGIGKRAENGIWTITRVIWPKQQNSAGASDMDDDDIAKYTAELKEGERILWWGHSHGRGSTYFSGKDETQWKIWADADPEFFFASVHNIKDEVYFRATTRGIIVESDMFHVHLVPSAEDEAPAKKIIKEQFRKFTPLLPSGKGKRGKRGVGEKTGTADGTLGFDDDDDQYERVYPGYKRTCQTLLDLQTALAEDKGDEVIRVRPYDAIEVIKIAQQYEFLGATAKEDKASYCRIKGTLDVALYDDALNTGFLLSLSPWMVTEIAAMARLGGYLPTDVGGQLAERVLQKTSDLMARAKAYCGAVSNDDAVSDLSAEEVGTLAAMALLDVSVRRRDSAFERLFLLEGADGHVVFPASKGVLSRLLANCVVAPKLPNASKVCLDQIIEKYRVRRYHGDDHFWRPYNVLAAGESIKGFMTDNIEEFLDDTSVQEVVGEDPNDEKGEVIIYA